MSPLHHPNGRTADLGSAAQEQRFLAYGMVAEEIQASLRADKKPDVADLIRHHPDLETEIRQLIPAMVGLHQLEAEVASVGGSAVLEECPQGRALGDFRIIREIGRGGMGVVYEAEQISLGRHVALKVLPFASMLDKRQLARFKNESRAAATLDHPNIVQVFSVGNERGVHYYAMQFIEGQSMAEVIGAIRKSEVGIRKSDGAGQSTANRGRRVENGGPRAESDEGQLAGAGLSPASEFRIDTVAALSTQRESNTPLFFRTVVNLGIQAAEALDHAHQQGIIHRDVKPGNLMLDGEGKLWITDFGLARIEADAGMTMTGDVLGTLRYMSPEQALAKRVVVDHRTDIYSLGATLYELLTLQPVFPGDDRQELLKQIALEEPRPLRRVSAAIPVELETIVQKALAKNPQDRYATSQELADDLQRLLDDKPIRARRPTTLERATKWSRRHKPLVRFAVALLLLTTVGLAASTFFIAREKARTAGALVTAESERENARVAADRARVAADRAQAMSLEARRAVDKMYLDVAQRWLRDQPHMTVVQEEFLRNALEFYQRFAKNDTEESGRDPSVRWKTAQAQKRVGDIQHRLGRYIEAEAAYREAVALVERLQAEDMLPTDVRMRSELVEAFAARSRVLLDVGHVPDALIAAREAIDFCNVVKSQKSTGPILSEVVADAHAALSAAQADLGHYAEAESAARRAIEWSEPQSESQPSEAGKGDNSAASRCRWAERHTELALLLDAQHRHAEAEPLHQHSREILDRLHDQRTGHDAALDYARAASLRGLAENRFEAGQITAAIDGFQQADEKFRELADRWANMPSYQLARLENLRRMAEAYFQANRFRDAESVLKEARGGFDSLVNRWPEGARHRGALAACYVQLGQSAATLGRNTGAARDYRNASTVLEELASDAPNVPTHRQRLAEALRGLGFAQQELAQSAAAEKSFRRAISLRDELAATDSDHLVHRRSAIEVRVLLGTALADLRRDKAAEAELRRAVTDAEQLADEYPELSYLRGEVSNGLAALAAFLSQRDGLTEAERLYRRAVTNGEESTKAHGEYRQYRFVLAVYYHNLALVLRQQNRHDETAAPLARAAELAALLAADFPEIPAYANVYAASLNELALAHRQAGQADEAGKALRQAHNIQEKLVERFPEVLEYRITLGNLLTNRADQLHAAEDFAAAQQTFQKATRVLETLVVDGRGRADSRRLLAHNLAMLAWCNCAGPDAKRDDPPQALRLAQRAVRLQGKLQDNDAWVRQVLGMALCRTGDWAGGLRELQTSMKHDNGGDGWQWMIVSLAHAKLGHADEARRWYKRGVDWAEQDPKRNKNQAFRRYREEAEEAQK